MNKKLYALTGSAVAVASTAMIIGYAIRKKKEEAVCAGVLLAGIAGLVGGAVIAYQPEKEAKKKLTVRDLLDDDDVLLVNKNIAEVLGSADGDATEQPFPAIEADGEI